MRQLIRYLLLLAVLFVGCGTQQGTYAPERTSLPPEEPVPSLNPYGIWADVPGLGRVWHPNVPFYWRPYADGQWYWTDNGWFWDTAEPFGWVVYHYGYWTQVDPMGWVWVPGYDWSPARVLWVFSDDLVGWAPMPPPGGRVPPVYDLDASRFWVVVPARDFASGNVSQFVGAAPHPGPDTRAYRTRSTAPDLRFVERHANHRIDKFNTRNENVRNGNRNLTRTTPTTPTGPERVGPPTAPPPVPPGQPPSQPRTTQGERRTGEQPQTRGGTDQKKPTTETKTETKPAKEGTQRAPRTTETRAPRDTTKAQPQKR